jgi:hypothetical protein
MKKLKWLCENSKFTTMRAIAERTELLHRDMTLEALEQERRREFDIVTVGGNKQPADEYENVNLI